MSFLLIDENKDEIVDRTNVLVDAKEKLKKYNTGVEIYESYRSENEHVYTINLNSEVIAIFDNQEEAINICNKWEGLAKIDDLSWVNKDTGNFIVISEVYSKDEICKHGSNNDSLQSIIMTQLFSRLLLDNDEDNLSDDDEDEDVDVKLVMAQTGTSKEKAKEVLLNHKGDILSAIIELGNYMP